MDTVQFLPGDLLFRFAAAPPTVRVAEGTPAGLIDETVRVVQAINAALPPARLLPECPTRKWATRGRTVHRLRLRFAYA